MYNKPTNIRAVSGLERVVHAVHFLLVSDQVLDSSHHTLFLNSLNRLSSSHGLEHRIGTETFPVTPSQRPSPQRPNRRSKIDIGAFPAELLAKSDSSCVHQLLVPSCAGRDTRREGRDVVRGSDAEGRVLEA